jgi:hypothetical protein
VTDQNLCTIRDLARENRDLRARLEIAEATNHVLTELLYDVLAAHPAAAHELLGGTRMSEAERLLGAIRCDHWQLTNDEIDALHQALLEADSALGGTDE